MKGRKLSDNPRNKGLCINAGDRYLAGSIPSADHPAAGRRRGFLGVPLITELPRGYQPQIGTRRCDHRADPPGRARGHRHNCVWAKLVR